MTPSPRKIALERFVTDTVAEFRAARRAVRAVSEARGIVAVFNARIRSRAVVAFYPTLDAALKAGRPILTVICPACQQTGAADLRKLDFHPATTVNAIARRMSCKRCCPNPPFAKIVGLRRPR